MPTAKNRKSTTSTARAMSTVEAVPRAKIAGMTLRLPYGFNARYGSRSHGGQRNAGSSLRRTIARRSGRKGGGGRDGQRSAIATNDCHPADNGSREPGCHEHSGKGTTKLS